MQFRSSWLIFTVAFVAIAKTSEAAKEDEVKIEILTPPPADCERKTRNLEKVAVHYVGTLTETGEKFYSSYDQNKPHEFQLGTEMVIDGWNEGLMGMCVGEKRKLLIPPSKGYGAKGAGKAIPPNAGLTFEVELLEIKDPRSSSPDRRFKEMDTNRDNRLSRDEVSQFLKQKMENKREGMEDEVMETRHKKAVSKLFRRADTNEDGFISHREFTEPKHDEL